MNGLKEAGACGGAGTGRWCVCESWGEEREMDSTQCNGK